MIAKYLHLYCIYLSENNIIDQTDCDFLSEPYILLSLLNKSFNFADKSSISPIYFVHFHVYPLPLTALVEYPSVIHLYLNRLHYYFYFSVHYHLHYIQMVEILQLLSC